MRRPDLISAAITPVLLVTLSVCGRAAENPPGARVAPERVAAEPAARDNREVFQFLGADAKGRVFLLHGDTLAVDQILPSGRIVAWRTPHGKEASDAEVIDAALSPDGSSWLVSSGPDDLILLSGDDRRQLPALHWWISALAYTADGPVVAVLPGRVGGADASSETAWDKPPFLLRLDDQKWQTLSVQEAGKLPSFAATRGERDTRLAAGRKGTLWATQKNAYALKRYSRQGTAEESVAVNGGQVQWKERTEEDWKAFEKASPAAGRTPSRSHRVTKDPVRVVRGMSVQDNRVYLVVETPEGGVALDRWDAETQRLDRLLLDGIAPGRGDLSLAAGRDGLYIAGRMLGEPIWRLEWQRLEGKWTAVPGAIAQRPGKE